MTCDVIFAIDARNWQAVAVFEQWLRDNGGKLLIGAYTFADGLQVRERSYLVSEEAFKTVKRMGIVDDQESFLFVTRCNKQYATLHYADGDVVPLGSLKCVSEEEAMAQDAWSYDPAFNRYFICVEGNPDGESPDARKQRKLFDAIEALLNQYEGGPVSVGRFEVLRDLRKQFDEQKPKWMK